jgi:hypothetical protein
MKKDLTIRVLLISLMILTGLSGLKAAFVTEAEAVTIARNFYYERFNSFQRPITLDDLLIDQIHTEIYQGQIVFYAFDFTVGGFVIVSAEDALIPVFGYDYKGRFQIPENPDRPGSFNWMDNYSHQVILARERNLPADKKTADEWNRLRSGFDLSSTSKGTRSVEPFLKSRWKEFDPPYNAYSPVDPGGYDGHCPTGWISTPLAQIFHYWRYPLSGTGYHQYYCPGYGTLSADFENTTYAYNSMLNELSTSSPAQSIEAVSQLIYHIDVAMETVFYPTVTSQSILNVGQVVTSRFNYSSGVTFNERFNYTTDAWEDLLVDELNNHYPILYYADNNVYAISFVCDGYQSGIAVYFHFIFPNGFQEGYFSLSDIYGYNNDHAFYSNMVPDDINFTYPYYCTGSSILASTSGILEDGSGPLHNYENNANCSWLIAPEIDSVDFFTISFEHFSTSPGDLVTIYDGPTIASPVLGSFSGNDLPGAVTTSEGVALVTFITDDVNTSSGWALKYTPDFPVYCPSGMTTLSDVSGTFEDGSGPFRYNAGKLCRWKIDVPGANAITLGFNSFESEYGFDNLTIMDLSTTPPTTIGVYSGFQLPPTITGGNPLMLSFITNDYFNFQGWEAWWESDNVGKEDPQGFSGFTIYPNPATEELTIEYSLASPQEIELKVIGLTGQVFYTRHIPSSTGMHIERIDLTNIPSGIYLIRMQSDNGIQNRKLVVSKE